MFGLLPKDEGFFDFFERAAANVHEGAKVLERLLKELRDPDSGGAQIHNIEHTGDHLTREAIEKLNRSFITPFDRDEIHELVSRMDDSLDRMDSAADRLVVYRITKVTEDAKALAAVIVKATALLAELMPMLRNLKQPQLILNKCMEIHACESEGDRIERHGLAALFAGGVDTAEIIKWKDIYADLEGAMDRCEDVANVVESIVIRHS